MQMKEPGAPDTQSIPVPFGFSSAPKSLAVNPGGGSFVLTVRSGNLEKLAVCLRFPLLHLSQNLSPSAMNLFAAPVRSGSHRIHKVYRCPRFFHLRQNLTPPRQRGLQISVCRDMNYGMIATGNHTNFDSLRGAPPGWQFVTGNPVII